MPRLAPIRPVSQGLPFRSDAYSWEDFEDFFCDFLAAGPTITVTPDTRPLSAKVVEAHPYGRKGDSQRGIDIRARMEHGKEWVFQCKHYKNWTLKQTKTAIAACKYEAEHKFLLVTCQVSSECKDIVKKEKDWTLWDARDISRNFLSLLTPERAARILYTCFGPGWDTALTRVSGAGPLVSASALSLAQSDESPFLHHRLPLVEREEVLKAMEAFTKATSERFLFLSGRGGIGKSRILIEYGQKFRSRHPGWTLRYVMEAPSGSLLPTIDAIEGPTVVVLDNAHLDNEIRTKLIAAVRQRRNLKIVYVLRPGHASHVRQELFERGIDPSEIQELPELRPLSDEGALQLVRSALEPEWLKWEGFLYRASRDCPLIAIIGAELIKKGEFSELRDHKVFQNRVFEYLGRQTSPVEKEGFEKLHIDDFLHLVALIGPVENSRDFRTKAAEFVHSSWPPDRVARLIGALRDAGLVVERGGKIRVIPDLFSDHLAYSACYDVKGRSTDFAQRVLDRFGFDDHPSILYRLAEAEWRALTKTSQADSVVEPLWERMVERFKSETFFERAQIVEKWAGAAAFLPEKTMELAQRAIRSSTAPRRIDDPLLGFAGQSSIDTHVYVLERVPSLLQNVANHHPEKVEECLDILWALAREHPAGNQTLNTIKEISTFRLWKDDAILVHALTWIERLIEKDAWLDGPGIPPHTLRKLLEPFFAAGIEDTFFTKKAMIMRPAPLNVAKTAPLRARSLALCENLLRKDSEAIALAVVSVLDFVIDEPRLPYGGSPPASMLEAWAIERARALEVVREVIERYPQPVVLQAVRRALLPLIRHESPGSVRQISQGLYRKIKDTPELRLLRITLSYRHEEFDQRVSRREFSRPRRTQDGRRSWIVRQERRWLGLLGRVGRELVANYPNPKDLLDYFSGLLDRMKPLGYSPNLRPILRVLCQHAPDYGIDLSKILCERPDHPLHWDFDIILHESTEPDAEIRFVLLEKALKSGNSELAAAAVRVLSWMRRHKQLAENAWTLLEEIAPNAEGVVALEIVGFCDWNTEVAGERDWRLLQRLPANAFDQKVAQAAGSSLAHAARDSPPGSPSVSQRPPAEVVSWYLEQIRFLPSVTNRQFEWIFSELAPAFPSEVFRFFIQRMEATGSEDLPKGYEPVPLWIDRLRWGGIGFCGDLTGEIAERFESFSSEVSPHFGAAQILSTALVSRGFRDPVFQMFLDRTNTAMALERLTDLVTLRDGRFMMACPDLVRQLIEKANIVDSATADSIIASLASSASTGVRSSSNGMPDETWTNHLERLRHLATEYSADAILGDLYDQALRGEEERLARMRARIEEE